MNNNNLTLKFLAVASAFLLNGFSLSPASHSSSEPGFESLASVSEGARVAHAKELLGSRYAGSDVQKTEGKKSLNQLIFEKLHSKLTLHWRGRARSIASAVIAESSRHNFDPVFVLAVIKTESNFNPQTVGRYGEIGLMQIKSDTAKWIAKKYNIPWKGPKSLRNPEMNIKIGTAYMSYLREQFDAKSKKYVSAYNMGPKNLRRLLSQNVKPLEYNSLVMKNYARLYSSLAASSLAASSPAASPQANVTVAAN